VKSRNSCNRTIIDLVSSCKHGEVWNRSYFVWKVKTYYKTKQPKQIFVSIQFNAHARTHTELVMKKLCRQKVLKCFHLPHLILVFGNVPHVLKKKIFAKNAKFGNPKRTKSQNNVYLMSFDVNLTSYWPNRDQNMTFFCHNLVNITSNWYYFDFLFSLEKLLF